MRLSVFNSTTLSEDQIYDSVFPKWYNLDFDHTCKTSGCFEERSGQILMNLHISDKSNDLDTPADVLTFVKNEFLEQKLHDYVLRCFIFSCNNLPPSDPNGLSDP